MAHHHKPKVTADGLIFYVDPLNPKSKDKIDNTDLSFFHESGSSILSGRGIRFDGSNDHILINSADQFKFKAGFSVSVWIKPDLTNWDSWGRVVDMWSGTGTAGWFVGRNSGTNNLEWRLETIDNAGDGSYVMEMTDDTWQHFVGVYDSDNDKAFVYKNGVLVDSDDTSGNFGSFGAHSAGMYIGRGSVYGESFAGDMADLRIFTASLDAGQAKQLYERPGQAVPLGAGISHESVNQSNESGSNKQILMAWWPMTEGTGSYVFSNSQQQSASANVAQSGSLVNGPTWVSGSPAGVPLATTGYSKKLWWDGLGSNTQLRGKESADFAVGTGNYTVAMWVNSNNYSTDNYYRRFWAHNDSGNTVGNIQMAISPTSVGVGVAGGLNIWDNKDICFGATNVCDNQWHHILLTRSGSDISVRVDGKLDGQGTGSDAIHSNSGKCTPLLGNWNANGDGCMSGYIDEVVFYNTALTGSDFELLARSASVGRPLPLDATTISGSNLKAYWRNGGNQTSGSWNDRSGNGNDMYVHKGGWEHTIPPAPKVHDSYAGRDANGFPFTNPNNEGYLNFYSGSTGNTSDIYHDTNNKIDDITQSTVSYWMRQTDHTGDGRGPFFISDSTGKGIFMQTRADRNYFHMCIETASICPQATSAQTQLIDGNWHAIDITRNGQTVTGYIDGQLIPTSNQTGYGSWNMGTSNTVLGGLADNNAIYRYLDCDIACFKIYNRPITRSEIERNFQMQRNRFGV